jgi:hypothetical protein
MPSADSPAQSPAWNFMQTELIPDDRIIQPLIGPGGLTRAQARAEILAILERGAVFNPRLASVASTWRGGAKDDTVYLGPFTWTIYEHSDPRVGALEWLEDYAAIMRQAGAINIEVAAPRVQE